MRTILVVLLALAVAPLGGCASSGAATRPGDPPAGSAWYTQFTLQFERGVYRTTNYRRGFTLPINTAVTLLSMDDGSIVVRIESTGARLEVENVAKHTNESTSQAFTRLFGEAPVDLSVFTDDEQTSIRTGRAEVGMGKGAVLAALGPPPAVGTPALESSEWKYWDSRFSTFVVRFDDGGRVVDTGR